MTSEKYKDPFGFIVIRPSLDKSNTAPFFLHDMADLVFAPTRQFRSAGLPFWANVSDGSLMKCGAPVEDDAPKNKTVKQ